MIWSCNSVETNSILTIPLERSEYTYIISEQGELDAKKAVLVQAPMVRGRELQITHLADEGSMVRKGDVVAILSSTELETRYLNASDEYDMAKAEMIQRESELKIDKTALEVEIQNAENSVKASELHLANIEFESPNVIQLEKLKIDKIKLDLTTAREKLSALKDIQKEEMIRMDLKVKQAKNDMNRTSADLAKLSLKAPVDGIVVYETNWMTGQKQQVGNSVYRNWPIVKIPDLSQMQVKLKLVETDAQRISKGQTADVQIFSSDTLHLSGKVSRKDRMAKPVKRNSKVKRVEVIVEIDSCDAKLTSGLSASCDIKIQTFENILALPYECIFDKDSLKVIYKKEASDKYIPHAIQALHYTDNIIIFETLIDLPAQITLTQPPEDWIQWPKEFKLPKIAAEQESPSKQDSTGLDQKQKGFQGKRPREMRQQRQEHP